MGQIWLFDLPDVLRAAGLDVDTYEDWEARARSSGGYDDILGVQVHHTASDTSPANDMNYMWGGSPDEPVGAIYLARTGKVTVGCAGATNTSGKGGPLSTSRGTIPLDAANRYVISIEAANNGVGEPWPFEQIVAYQIMSRALVDRYGLRVQPGDLHAHFEWTSRKIDPAGNSPYASGGASWNMGAFRRDVDALNPDPGPDPEPIPIPGEDMSTKTILIDVAHNAPYGILYLCDANTKSWVQDGDMAAQLQYRVMEAQGKSPDYTKPPDPLENLRISPGVALDGHYYSVVRNGDVTFVASFGPIVGPRPAGVDEFGR